MALKRRLKQALLVIGALTVIGIGFLGGGALYLLWDARKQEDEPTDFSSDISSLDVESNQVETPDTEESASAETDAESSTASDVSA